MVITRTSIKGTSTVSMFLTRDLILIGVEAIAFYLLLTLCDLAWDQHIRDKLE